MLKAKHLIALLVVAALAATGCGDTTTTGNATIDARQASDTAYEAVAKVQVANALNYSNAILKTTKDPEIKKFAKEIVAERTTASDILDRVTNTGTPTTVKKASHELDVSLKRMAVSADGKPFVAPTTDEGYLTAMKANLKGTLAAAAAHQNHGGPGTSQLSSRLLGSAEHELEQLKQIQK